VLSVQGYATPEQYACAKDYIVSGHDSRLGQVVVNLIENAISFSPKGGSIYVSAKKLPENNQIEISVEDEGPGIRDENLEKIFRRFYTDRPESFGNNSGLGLNISQQIVRAHGGGSGRSNRRCPGPPVQRPRRRRTEGAPLQRPVRRRNAARRTVRLRRLSAILGARFMIWPAVARGG
jgi:two-component system sensor histidine kinase ChvG